MCKTIEETVEKIRKFEQELVELKQELDILQEAQCPLCRQRMDNMKSSK